MLRTAALLLPLLLGTATLHAQVTPDEVHLGNNCRLARQVIETGRPAPHMDWALLQIGACEPASQGSALAAAVRRLRAETDTAVLREFWRPSRYLRDGELFGASLEVAADHSASTESRVFALLSLLHVVRFGRSADYRHMVGGFEEDAGLRRVRGGCAQIVVSDDVRLDGAPLPAAYREQVRALVSRLRADSAAPIDVQTAASCV